MAEQTAAEYIKDRASWIVTPDGSAADVQKVKTENGWGIYLLVDGYYADEADAEAMREFNQERVEEVLRTEGVLRMEARA